MFLPLKLLGWQISGCAENILWFLILNQFINADTFHGVICYQVAKQRNLLILFKLHCFFCWSFELVFGIVLEDSSVWVLKILNLKFKSLIEVSKTSNI